METAAERQGASQHDDAATVRALRAGDEDTFRRLVREWNAALLRVARIYVPNRTVAEDVVQETWLRALRGLDGFEGRSSLRTWVFRILVNTARTRAAREGRTIPFSALRPERVEEPAVEPERFLPDDHERWPAHWAAPPPALPEERVLAAETRARIAAALETLPPAQRAVVSLRDVEGWSSEEVRNALDLSEVNQRVLLHRGRAKLRRALEEYLAEETS